MVGTGNNAHEEGGDVVNITDHIKALTRKSYKFAVSWVVAGHAFIHNKSTLVRVKNRCSGRFVAAGRFPGKEKRSVMSSKMHWLLGQHFACYQYHIIGCHSEVSRICFMILTDNSAGRYRTVSIDDGTLDAAVIANNNLGKHD